MKRLNVFTEIENIKNQLISKYKPKKIILFGSAARGDFGKDSDLDFLVVMNDRRKPIEVEQEFHQVIDYRLASDFLFMPWNEYQKRMKIKDFFIREILNDGKILYG